MADRKHRWTTEVYRDSNFNRYLLGAGTAITPKIWSFTINWDEAVEASLERVAADIGGEMWTVILRPGSDLPGQERLFDVEEIESGR